MHKHLRACITFPVTVAAVLKNSFTTPVAPPAPQKRKKKK
jgi:hypothetical protein